MRAAARLVVGRTLVLVVLVVLVGLLACRGREPKVTGEFLAMGGIPVHVTGFDVAPDDLAPAVASFRLEVQRLESIMSAHRATSALSRLNAAPDEAVPVPPELADCVAAALRYAQATEGAFDPTCKPILDVWKAAAKAGTRPRPEALAAARRHVGADRVRVERRGGEWFVVRPPGTTLDLGGIAKGWFADVGVASLRRAGLRRGLVELGGDLAAFDDTDAPAPFRVGVQHPRRPDALLGVLSFDGGGVVTSGDYERGYDVAGTRVNHIVDPRTGQPSEGVFSVTLLAPTGTAADALATGVLVLGGVRGMALVEALPDVEAVIVVAAPEAPEGFAVRVSSGLEGKFERSAPPAVRR